MRARPAARRRPGTGVASAPAGPGRGPPATRRRSPLARRPAGSSGDALGLDRQHPGVEQATEVRARGRGRTSVARASSPAVRARPSSNAATRSARCDPRTGRRQPPRRHPYFDCIPTVTAMEWSRRRPRTVADSMAERPPPTEAPCTTSGFTSTTSPARRPPGHGGRPPDIERVGRASVGHARCAPVRWRHGDSIHQRATSARARHRR